VIEHAGTKRSLPWLLLAALLAGITPTITTPASAATTTQDQTISATECEDGQIIVLKRDGTTERMCREDYTGSATPVRVVPSSTLTPTPNEESDPPSSLDSADSGAEVESDEQESVESLLDENGGETVIVKKSNGEIVVGQVDSREKAELAAHDEVSIVTSDSRVHLVEVPWGLDRINQSSWPLDDKVRDSVDGAGVRVYVLDTGIDYNHSGFAGRAERRGFDPVDGDTIDEVTGEFIINDGDPMDCHGHGTHVAGTIASKSYGIATGATVVGVRVMRCGGWGLTSDIIKGLKWVIDDAAGRPAVVNMSIGGGFNDMLNEQVQDVIDAGITVVVAAGNETVDASTRSPASVTDAITVGATGYSCRDADCVDAIAGYSNFGPMVDLWAPGTAITSLAAGGGLKVLSGTSMAAPHVAGAAAGYLADNPSSTPTDVDAALKELATSTVDHSTSTSRFLQWRANTPIIDDPVTDDPIVDDPAPEDPVTDDPVTDDPVTDDPVTEDPAPVAPSPVDQTPPTYSPPTDEQPGDVWINKSPVTEPSRTPATTVRKVPDWKHPDYTVRQTVSTVRLKQGKARSWEFRDGEFVITQRLWNYAKLQGPANKRSLTVEMRDNTAITVFKQKVKANPNKKKWTPVKTSTKGKIKRLPNDKRFKYIVVFHHDGPARHNKHFGELIMAWTGKA